MKMKPVVTRKAWTNEDMIDLLWVYNTFLQAQIDGTPYTKASAVRALAANQQRSKGSVECKMMNVSAVLQFSGRTWVKGYKPLANFNKAMIGQVNQFYIDLNDSRANDVIEYNNYDSEVA